MAKSKSKKAKSKEQSKKAEGQEPELLNGSAKRADRADEPAAKEALDEGAAAETPAEAVEPDPDAPISPKAWGEPILRFDRKWTAIEARLCWWVLGLEVLTLFFAVTLSGMSTGGDSAAKNGVVFRSFLTALLLGTTAHFSLKNSKYHPHGVTAAVILGLVLGPTWANVGADYFANMRNWMQNASSMALFGGVSNLAKRLTILLALLGASIATAQGKHINVDVAMRFLPPRGRVPVALFGWVFAAIVCFAGAWGFVDQIAIENFRIEDTKACPGDAKGACVVPVGERLSSLKHEIGRDMFLFGRQISLDLKTAPRVLKGEKYDAFLSAADWNAWVKDGNWTEHFPEADVKGIYADETQPTKRSPGIAIPGALENPQELLIRELNLLFPVGLFLIAVRFVIRCLLVLSGQIKVDLNAAHAEEGKDDDTDADAAKGGAS
jgi:TRAP-type C4-dicarboxylate transport system permease small subunit